MISTMKAESKQRTKENKFPSKPGSTSVICRYAEIGLKGKNRGYFEKKLIENIKKCLKWHNLTFTNIERPRGRIIIHTDTKNKDFSCLQKVFGLSTYSFAIQSEPTFEGVMAQAKELAKENNLNKNKTFRVTTQRLDKNFPFTSQDVDVTVGRFLQNEFQSKVKLKNPDFELCVEIIQKRIFLFTKKIPCFGGLPIGSEGRVILLLEKEEDLLAGLLFMKRGSGILPVSKKDLDLKLLKEFSFSNLRILKIKNESELDKLAEEHKAKALVFGQNIKTIDDFGLKTPILRPLVGLNNTQIKNKLDKFKNAAKI